VAALPVLVPAEAPSSDEAAEEAPSAEAAELYSLGFPLAWCVRAVDVADGNFEEALNWILTHSNELAELDSAAQAAAEAAEAAVAAAEATAEVTEAAVAQSTVEGSVGFKEYVAQGEDAREVLSEVISGRAGNGTAAAATTGVVAAGASEGEQPSAKGQDAEAVEAAVAEAVKASEPAAPLALVEDASSYSALLCRGAYQRWWPLPTRYPASGAGLRVSFKVRAAEEVRICFAPDEATGDAAGGEGSAGVKTAGGKAGAEGIEVALGCGDNGFSVLMVRGAETVRTAHSSGVLDPTDWVAINVWLGADGAVAVTANSLGPSAFLQSSAGSADVAALLPCLRRVGLTGTGRAFYRAITVTATAADDDGKPRAAAPGVASSAPSRLEVVAQDCSSGRALMNKPFLSVASALRPPHSAVWAPASSREELAGVADGWDEAALLGRLRDACGALEALLARALLVDLVAAGPPGTLARLLAPVDTGRAALFLSLASARGSGAPLAEALGACLAAPSADEAALWARLVAAAAAHVAAAAADSATGLCPEGSVTDAELARYPAVRFAEWLGKAAAKC